MKEDYIFGACSTHVSDAKYTVWYENLKDRNQLKEPRLRWEDIMKMGLKERSRIVSCGLNLYG
jgi:hypothetical protein